MSSPAASRGTHNGNEFAIFHFEAELIERDGFYFFSAVRFLEIGDLDHNYKLFR